MIIKQLVLAEFRRLFSSSMSILALAAIVFVPVLYGGLYLWANQDPYERLGNIPVALVISDTGAVIGNQEQNLGEDAAQAILESNSFDWQIVSHQEAQTGLIQGRYDFSVEFPATFSTDVASLATNNPKQAEIILQRNDANNYLASTIGTQALEQIQITVTEQVVSQSSRTALDALAEIRTSLLDAASGAQEISTGSQSAQSGVNELINGANALGDGLGQLNTGTSTRNLLKKRVALTTGTRQTLPEPLAALHHILPRGYVVDALRQAMYGGELTRIAIDFGVLAIWAVTALALSALGVAKLTRHRTMRDLEPSIIQ